MMPTYRVAISDEECVSNALEDYASIEMAQKSVARTALAFLTQEGRLDSRQVAECEIQRLDGTEELHFLVAVELISIMR